MARLKPALTVCALAAGLSLTAPVAFAASGVNIIYPPKLPAAFDAPDDPAPAVAAHEHAVQVRFFMPTRAFILRERRREAIRRAFGHRYLGFKKVYSGPRYPF